MYKENDAKFVKTRRKKHRKSSSIKRRKRNKVVLLIILIIFILFFIGVCIWILGSIKNPLKGRWVYDDYTQYVFDKNGKGCLEVDDISYEYAYKIDSNKLELDFSEDIVRDCEYTFFVEENKLTLVGGNNTDGGTYQLTRK